MLPENETVTFEDRVFVNPETSMNEQLSFVDNLRAVQQANNQEINADLENLGTYPASQSNLGGLLGGSGYFTSRYQTPQTVALVSDLSATARAAALNQALQNEQAKWRQRYSRARSANYRRNAAGGGSGGGGGSDDQKKNSSSWSGEYEDIYTDGTGYVPKLNSMGRGTTVVYNGSKWVDSKGGGGYGFDIYDENGNLIGRDNVVLPAPKQTPSVPVFPAWDEIGRITGSTR